MCILQRVRGPPQKVVGTPPPPLRVLRLARGAWSIVKLLRKARNEDAPPPGCTMWVQTNPGGDVLNNVDNLQYFNVSTKIKSVDDINF